jgi:hypothetical protein
LINRVETNADRVSAFRCIRLDEVDRTGGGWISERLDAGRHSFIRSAMWLYSTFLHEQQSIGFAYALEQALNARQQPQFLGANTAIPNADLCTQPHQPHGKEHLLHGKVF